MPNLQWVAAPTTWPLVAASRSTTNVTSSEPACAVALELHRDSTSRCLPRAVASGAGALYVTIRHYSERLGARQLTSVRLRGESRNCRLQRLGHGVSQDRET